MRPGSFLESQHHAACDEQGLRFLLLTLVPLRIHSFDVRTEVRGGCGSSSGGPDARRTPQHVARVPCQECWAHAGSQPRGARLPARSSGRRAPKGRERLGKAARLRWEHAHQAESRSESGPGGWRSEALGAHPPSTHTLSTAGGRGRRQRASAPRRSLRGEAGVPGADPAEPGSESQKVLRCDPP